MPNISEDMEQLGLSYITYSNVNSTAILANYFMMSYEVKTMITL